MNSLHDAPLWFVDLTHDNGAKTSEAFPSYIAAIIFITLIPELQTHGELTTVRRAILRKSGISLN